MLLGFIQAAGQSAVPGWLQVADTAVGIFQAFVSGAAVIGGAIWAYFRFVKGRTFSRRLEPVVAGEVIRRDGVLSVTATITAKNIGASKIDVEPRYCALRVLAYGTQGGTIAGEVSWTRLATLPVLQAQVLLEPGETIGEQVLFETPDRSYVAFKVDAAQKLINEKKGFLPVLHQERQVWGVLTDRDIIARVVAENK